MTATTPITIKFPNNTSTTINTGLFIAGEFVSALDGKTFATLDPSNGAEVCQVSEASAKDVDVAVKAARKAYVESWGERMPGSERGKLLMRLADLVDKHTEELAALESLDNGKAYSIASTFDVPSVAQTLRYYGGFADKNHGQTIEVDNSKDFHYTRHEPIGVVGQIIPWNFPILMAAWKLGPALCTGNTVVIKSAEQTPLSILKLAELIKEAGFPPGVVNVVSGFGPVAGAAIANHMDIDKIAFTGSTLVGRNIMKAAATSNLKAVTLELGGKSPNVVFSDCDLDQAVGWCCFGIYFNHGQACCAGSRVYVEESIYDEFMKKVTEKVQAIRGMVGDAFDANTFQGPQVSQLQVDRIMAYIQSGKDEGATLAIGGGRMGNEKGYFIEPTVFTDVKPDAKIAREEIFGPVVVVSKFSDEEDLIRQANDSVYGLAASVHTQNMQKGIKVAHRLQAGTVWVNQHNQLSPQVPFGGFKQSGIGRELGAYALANYTAVKSVHINLGKPSPL